MTIYGFVLYLHILGALALFAALGIEWVAWLGVRAAATAEWARIWLGSFRSLQILGPLAFVLLLVSGLYMTATGVGWQGWNVVGLGALLVIAALGAAVNGRRVPGLGRMLASSRGVPSPELEARLRDPVLWFGLITRTAIALGVVLLMTVKPDAIVSLVTLVAFAVVGAAVALATGGGARRPAVERAH